MSTIHLPTRSSSAHVASELSAMCPPGGGHPPSPTIYDPEVVPCHDEVANPADRKGLLDLTNTPVENCGHALPAGITRKNRDLSEQEQQTLQYCEQTIRKGLQAFFTVGKALLQIQDGRLYRQTHPTFEAYCRGSFRISHSHAYRHIEGAKVLQNLSPIGDKPMPANEAQTRPLVPLPPGDQLKVWRRVVATTPPHRITAKVVEDAAKEFLHLKDAGRSQQGGRSSDSVIEIAADTLRDATDLGSNEAKAGAGSPPDPSKPTECARASGIRPSAGSIGSPREDSFEPPQSPTSVVTEPSDAVAPSTPPCANPSAIGEQPSADAVLEGSNLAMPTEGGQRDGGELTEFLLANGSTAQAHLLPGRRPEAAEILGTLAFMAKTYPKLQPPVSQPELIQSQRLLLECAAQINRCIGDRPRVELSRAVQRLGGELNDLIVRPRQAA